MISGLLGGGNGRDGFQADDDIDVVPDRHVVAGQELATAVIEAVEMHFGFQAEVVGTERIFDRPSHMERQGDRLSDAATVQPKGAAATGVPRFVVFRVIVTCLIVLQRWFCREGRNTAGLSRRTSTAEQQGVERETSRTGQHHGQGDGKIDEWGLERLAGEADKWVSTLEVDGDKGDCHRAGDAQGGDGCQQPRDERQTPEKLGEGREEL